MFSIGCGVLYWNKSLNSLHKVISKNISVKIVIIKMKCNDEVINVLYLLDIETWALANIIWSCLPPDAVCRGQDVVSTEQGTSAVELAVVEDPGNPGVAVDTRRPSSHYPDLLVHHTTLWTPIVLVSCHPSGNVGWDAAPKQHLWWLDEASPPTLTTSTLNRSRSVLLYSFLTLQVHIQTQTFHNR